jgi:DNA-binding winged helix-turn-helix (wHTH) protein/tetratricopeptide (TPR) repeat protein
LFSSWVLRPSTENGRIRSKPEAVFSAGDLVGLGEKFCFGPFEVRTRAREILKGGTRIKLRGQPYLILELLLSHAGEVVTRDEIRKALWSADTFVDFEHGLNTSVKKLRQVLCDSAEAPRYIETLPRLGYRFIAPVEVVTEAITPPTGTRAFSAEELGQGIMAAAGLNPENPRAYDAPSGNAARSTEVTPAQVTSAQIESAKAERITGARPSWLRPWLLAAGLCAALLVSLLLAGARIYRSHPSTRLTDKDTIILADFSNSTGEPVFDDALRTALSVSLRQSPFLNVLSDSQITKTLLLMTRPASTKLTPEVARELCQRAGSKAYIAGSIGSLGSEYVLGLKAVNCQTGDTLAEDQVTAASKEEVLDALGRAASKLRAKLGESLATVQEFDVPLAQATTSSLEALKAYSLGMKVFYEKGAAAALPYNQRAIQLDSNFAMAHQLLGLNYYSLGELGQARAYVTKAFELREHASEREKLAITAYYYDTVTGQLDQAIQTYLEEIESYPRESGVHANLGYVYGEQGQYDKAAEITRQDLSVAPERVITYENLANYELALQHFDQAEQTIHQAQARKLDDVMFHFALYALAFLGTDSGAMAEQRKWFADRPEDENWGLAFASDTEAYAGRLRKARELTKAAVDSAVRTDRTENGAMWQAISAQREAAYGYRAQARREAANALRLTPDSRSAEVEAALAFAMAGDTAQAEALAQDLNKRFPLSTQMQSLWLPAIQGQLALDQKNPDSALKFLRAATPLEFGQIGFVLNTSCLYDVYVRGEAYLAAGQGGAAAAEFQKILDHNGIVWNCWTGALAHLGIARANALETKDSQGADADAARSRARAAYKDFLTLWKDADPDLPILQEAKAEYAKLQ